MNEKEIKFSAILVRLYDADLECQTLPQKSDNCLIKCKWERSSFISKM